MEWTSLRYVRRFCKKFCGKLSFISEACCCGCPSCCCCLSLPAARCLLILCRGVTKTKANKRNELRPPSLFKSFAENAASAHRDLLQRLIAWHNKFAQSHGERRRRSRGSVQRQGQQHSARHSERQQCLALDLRFAWLRRHLLISCVRCASPFT